MWEVEIKRAVGKLVLDVDLQAALRDSGVRELRTTRANATGYAAIPLPHRDPFDRLLLAQARAEGLDLLTANRAVLDAVADGVHDARV